MGALLWLNWTDAEWLSFCDTYHNSRMGAEAWGALSPVERARAVNSARTLLQAYQENLNFPPAVAEQALWLTSEGGRNALSDYSSVSVGEGSVSVSYGRSQSGDNRPPGIAPQAWMLLKPGLGAGAYTIGRVI
jgi:hypothetical protein